LSWGDVPSVAFSVTVAVLGIIALAIGLTGYFKTRVSWYFRLLALVAAVLSFVPHVEVAGRDIGLWVDLSGILLLAVIVGVNWTAAGRTAVLDQGS
jgi:TRAP-type uncharacterized transport system fused permease subunit